MSRVDAANATEQSVPCPPSASHCSTGCPHSSTSPPGSVPSSHSRRKQNDASWRGHIRQEAFPQLKQVQRYLWHHICNSRLRCVSSKAHGFSLDSSDLLSKNKLAVSVGTVGEAGPDPALLSPVNSSTTAPSQERDLTHMVEKNTLSSVSYHTEDTREGKRKQADK